MRSQPLAHSDSRAESRAAHAVLVSGLSLLIVGLIFGVSSFVIAGGGLSVIGALAPVWARVGTTRVSATREMLDHRAIEGELLEGVIRVRGGGTGLRGVEVLDALSGRVHRVPRGWRRTRRAATVELEIVATAERRGRQSLPPPALRFSDPLGLTSFVRPGIGRTDEVIVLPRTEPVQWRSVTGRSLAGDDAAGRTLIGAGEVDGLREYRIGAPAARIHWPALARGAGLLERRLVAAAEGRPLLVVDPRCGQLPGGALDLDESVRAAASLAHELARRGGCLVLLPGSGRPRELGADLRAWPSVHTGLALIAPERNHRRTPQLRPEILRGPLIYVGAADIELSPMALAAAHGVIRILPRRMVPAAVDPILSVAGCAGWVHTHRHSRRVAA